MSNDVMDTIEDVFALGTVGTLAVARLAVPVGVGVSVVKENGRAKKVSELTEQTYDLTASSKMLEAAYKGKLKDFKKALEDGGNITAINKNGQDALMIAVMGGSDEIANYILDTPELASQIDYKRCDHEGMTLQDFIEKRLKSNISSKSHSARMNSLKWLDVNKKVSKNLMKQTLEEAQGKARSDTNYDLCQMIDRNMIER